MAKLADKREEFARARAALARRRGRRRALGAEKRAARRRVALRVAVVAALLASFALLGFVVGNADYQVTLVGWVPLLMALSGMALAGAYVLVLKSGIGFEEQMGPGECPRDSDLAFTVSFRNRTPLVAVRMKVYFYVSDMFGNIAHEAFTTMALSPFERYDLSFSARFEHIGNYHAGFERLEVSDFLGLFSYTVNNPSRSVVQVTPKLVELDGIGFSDEALDEATNAAKSHLADSMDYAYVREYEPGDPLKTIHWKLSARAGAYMTRLYEVYSNPSVVVVLDFFAPSDEAGDLMSMFDAVVESAFSLARYARRQGMDVELRYRDKDGQPACLKDVRQQPLRAIVETFPAMSNDPDDAQAALDVVSGQDGGSQGYGNLFVCSGNVGADMVAALLEAKARKRSPLLVAAVPPGLLGRQREDHCAALLRLEPAGVPYYAIARSDELVSAAVA